MTPHVSITLLRTQTDERLVDLTVAGHDRAFDAIVDRYRRPLLRYARRFLPEEARAEDVVQAAFVSAWGALRDGAPVRDLRPWLYRIVHNGALNAMKKPGGDDAPLIEASDLRPGPATEVEQREDVRQALDTIAALPERQRAALLAVAVDGRSHADVGAELGLNDTAVRQLVSRARAALRVAATAVTPWPVAVWLAGIGGVQAADTATRIGEIVGGVGAGTLFGGSALKAGAVVAAAGAVAVGVPAVDQVVRERPRPAVAAQASERGSATAKPPAGTSGPTAALISAPAGSAPGAAGEGSGTSRSGTTDKTASGRERGEDPGPGERGAPGGPLADVDDGRNGRDERGRREERDADGPEGGREPGDDDAPRAERRERRGSDTHGGEDDVPEIEDRDEPRAPEGPEPVEPPEPPEPREDSSGNSGSSGSGSGSSDRAEIEDSHGSDDDVPRQAP